MSAVRFPKSGISERAVIGVAGLEGEGGVDAECHEQDAGDIGADGADVLQPAAGPEPDDVESHRDPERAKRGGQDVGPVTLRPVPPRPMT